MHRDIVPRAFACDYSLVADLLGRVSESFRTQGCLHGSRRKVHISFCKPRSHCLHIASLHSCSLWAAKPSWQRAEAAGMACSCCWYFLLGG